MKCWKCKTPSIPVARKCCCLVPLRKSLITYGYVNLALTTLSLPVFIFMLVEYRTTGTITVATLPIEPEVHLPINIALCAIDVALTVILLIGTHKNIDQLLKSFLYMGIIYVFMTVCVDLFLFEFDEYTYIIGYVCFTALNVYILFLVYSFIFTLQTEVAVQYVTYREPQ